MRDLYWQISALTEARLGARGTYYQEGARLALNPRFALNRHLRENLRFKLGGGSYRQYLQLISSEGFSGADAWVPLDESVAPGRSWQGVLGLEWEPSDTYRLSAETYYTDLANLVMLDEEASPGRMEDHLNSYLEPDMYFTVARRGGEAEVISAAA